MEQLEALNSELRYLLAVGGYAGWAARLTDAQLAIPTFGDATADEIAFMTEAARQEAIIRAAPRRKRGWRRSV